jgi:hypothetical protein
MGELHSSETAEAPWDTISVDFIVKLPESHGYDAIMCIVDSLTKRMHFIPTYTTTTRKVQPSYSIRRSENTTGHLG